MTNPFTSAVGWLIANPLASHAVVSSIECLVLVALLSLGLSHFGIEQIPAWLVAIIVPAIVVSSVYYGREAGQREHDLKNAGTSRFMAFLGAKYGFRWSLDNLVQWLAAAGATAAVAAALTFAGLYAG